MNQVFALRKREDLAKLRALRERMPRTLEIIRESGDPPNWITLAIHIPTAPNQSYPREKQLVSEVDIKLPEQYPLKAGPKIVFTSPIWNPNVFDSGRWCYGDKWSITENLEMLVIRLMQVIALDPAVINLKSAANREAAGWYHRMMKANSRIFPTISVIGLMAEQPKKKMTWRTIQ